LVSLRLKSQSNCRLQITLQKIDSQFDQNYDYFAFNWISLIFQNISKYIFLYLDCKVKITQNAISKQGTTANLLKNYWISIEDLLYGAMLPSGNDAAYMLAEYIGYFMYVINVEQKGSEYFTSF
jgi:hypothetical protein